MADEQHRDERERHKDRGVGEEDGHAHMVHQEAREHGRDDLRGHTGGVVKSGVFAHVRAGAELHDHREGVDVDRCPADAREGEHEVHEHGGALRAEERRHAEGHAEHHDAGEDRLLAADLGGDDADREIRDDRRGLRDDEREVVVLVQNVRGVDGVFARHGVVAHEPEHDGREDEQQRLLLARGEPAARAGLGVRLVLLDAEALGVLVHLLNQLRLLHREQENDEREQHHGADHAEVDLVAHEGVFHAAGREDHAERQHENAARAAHEIDDRVRLRAERLDRHVRHQRHGGGAEGRHRDERD